MPDLAEFLRQRLDEDEAAACALNVSWPFPWEVDIPDPRLDETLVRDAQSYPIGVCTDCGTRAEYDRDVARHIARWDPARVLAEIKAKRVILDAISDLFIGRRIPLDPTTPALIVARAMAQPYTGHPDFDPSWAHDA